MKKLIVAIVVLGALAGGGWLLYTKAFAPPKKRACAKLVELCGGDDSRLAKCEEGLTKMRDLAGEKAIERATGCLEKADSCVAGAGCVFGAGVGAFGDFLEGMKKALEK